MMSNVEGNVKIEDVNSSSCLNCEPRVFVALPDPIKARSPGTATPDDSRL